MEKEKTALLTVGEGDFDRLVLDSPQPAVVDFSAAWCGPVPVDRARHRRPRQ